MRAAAYDAMAAIPGVQVTRKVSGPLGRSGVGVALRDHTGSTMLILHRDDYRQLGTAESGGGVRRSCALERFAGVDHPHRTG